MCNSEVQRYSQSYDRQEVKPREGRTRDLRIVSNARESK